MKNNQFVEMAKEFEALKAQETAIKERLKALRSGMINEMANRGEDTIVLGGYKVKNTEYISKRFDSTTFKTAEPEMYAEYLMDCPASKFTVTQIG